MKNFSISNFSLSISDTYEYRGSAYRNYDFSSEDGIDFAYFSVCLDENNEDSHDIPEAYDFSDQEVKSFFEEIFRTKTNEEIKNLF